MEWWQHVAGRAEGHRGGKDPAVLTSQRTVSLTALDSAHWVLLEGSAVHTLPSLLTLPGGTCPSWVALSPSRGRKSGQSLPGTQAVTCVPGEARRPALPTPQVLPQPGPPRCSRVDWRAGHRRDSSVPVGGWGLGARSRTELRGWRQPPARAPSCSGLGPEVAVRTQLCSAAGGRPLPPSRVWAEAQPRAARQGREGAAHTPGCVPPRPVHQG